MIPNENSVELSEALKLLCTEEKYVPYFSKLLQLPVLSDNDVQQLINILTELLLNSNYTQDIVKYFSKYLLHLLSRAIPLDSTNLILDYDNHAKNCIVLSLIIKIHPDALRFALQYFDKYPSPFDKEYFDDLKKNVPTKKRKLSLNAGVERNDFEIVNCCYVFLQTDAEYFRPKWNWSKFITLYFNHKNDMVKWILCQCIAIVTGMNDSQLMSLLESLLSKDKIIECYMKFHKNTKIQDLNINISACKENTCLLTRVQRTNKLDLFENVISVGGILLPIYKKVSNVTHLVRVNSAESNLRKVALGIAANRAICLQGPVGSSKTALVEYLAALTGRHLGESFIKVQLGDQTDSKMLLGTYRCTDIPGEFIWQPGVLTQAVMEGNWLLLEDIDSANMDIATVVNSLLENGYLSVPGYRDTVAVTSGFQLFVTQRLISNIFGHHKKHSNVNALLEKHLLQINVEPLTQDELIAIIKERFPMLKTIATRIVDVFMLFSMEHTTTTTTTTSGRLTSTRDLFKWCERAIIDFDVSSQSSALKVVQDAIDIFCCSLPSIEERLRLAKQICVRLGIVETKAEYYCNAYKPNLSLTNASLVAGRTSIARQSEPSCKASKFSFTRPTACLLERIISCINLKEPVLLVGETGTGKTSSIQYVAHTIGQKLIVINMNQQSDSADLLGGYKPVDFKYIIAPIRLEFELLFREYFSVKHNQKFLEHIVNCFNAAKWTTLLTLMKHSQMAAMKRLQQQQQENPTTTTTIEFQQRWSTLGVKLNKLSIQLKQQNALAFSFIEGSLVKAIENGFWVLLDEINLANAETLECLSGLLEGSKSSLSLLERGDKKPIVRHENFILFACMNPSTDVGKKDLPAGLRNRFTEFFVEELTEKSDLQLLVNSYLRDVSVPQHKIESIVKFYLNVRKEALVNLSDGLGHKPHYSLRTLCRALTIAAKNTCGLMDRNLYEAFCLSFLTQLDSNSYQLIEQMIAKTVIGNLKEVKSVLLKQPIMQPKSNKENTYIQFEGYWISQGSLEPQTPKEYVLTESVRRNLKDLLRVVAFGRLPVLLQGDTSVGKTSLIMYLAKSSGNKCVRINNHEHTDLQEYIGSYVADIDGKLVFREGVLVEAMRKGHWIVLDELNLAPTDVLEALNRVLDDNRELFIPETQETVKAHPKFMLFATQNPPGAYGGRKMLSRAFRNRFVELHFNEIPPNELETILHQRCEIPLSYCKKMIAVMTDLQLRRRGSAAFAGKQGFITLRDLFRWGERYRLAANIQGLYDWDQHIADEGYLVLAGRVRKNDERKEIAEVLKKHIKRSVIPDNLFSLHEKTSTITKKILQKIYDKRHLYKNIVWTFNTRQLAVLVGKALEFQEPVLLVGETGGGKTTVCKLIAENNGQSLVTVNCHMHTESSDFIGGLRPVREHNEENKNKLFEWVDGPLLQAMLKGNVFLADEISLADDSVLERLNSLLEPERSLLLSEKGTDSYLPCVVTAHEQFHFIGTMNPGGDFGKKELSPALRNRFTEIWCEPCSDRNDFVQIIEHNLISGVSFGNQEDGSSGIGRSIMDFIEWFRNNEIGKRFTISIRDILTWVNFINVCSDKIEISDAYIHGACLTFLDSFGSGVTGTESVLSLKKLRDDCTEFLKKQITSNGLTATCLNFNHLKMIENKTEFGIDPFLIKKGTHSTAKDNFTFSAPTTLFNALRLLRGLQLNKAILLEGSPGVGKTSLVSALANITNNKLLRINLSDQTDICDLFGADLPVEGGQGGVFAWRDGPFLQALKNGDWIVLDELNLASQSVLEGLNACLDHRGEIFIPELGKSFYVKSGTRLFACQNPVRQGGSRRGLPKSFLNRFTQVYVDSLTEQDLLLILRAQFGDIPLEVHEKMVEFNRQVVSEIEAYKFGHKGSPWEFNLRDLTRWCQVMMGDRTTTSSVHLIYGGRMRNTADRVRVQEIFEGVFGAPLTGNCPVPYVTRDYFYMGDVRVKRGSSECAVNLSVLRQDKQSMVLKEQFETLRSLMYCVNMNWMTILVGSSACGKSSVVKTLAQLSGCELRTLSVNSAMDTTDILGGFEQVDYNRHLEEISNKVERILLTIIQRCFLNASDIKKIAALMEPWEEYRNIRHKEAEHVTMADETKLFTIKLSKLKEITETLTAHKFAKPNFAQLVNLQKRMTKLESNIEAEGTLNAGGKFEWVDSILVKCLQDGCWLLLENVNLCSPAVLDRLNALLEPNGVLTIGERGVDENGEMINIIPHPNFRLFLTMDPKNGEISRAMRNRGIEIYMLNENESGIRNENDTKALIEQNGLNIEGFQNILMKIHDYISSTILGEHPNISHILQASFLISQQLLRGINIIEAFKSSIIDVYVKTKSTNDFNIHDPVTIIGDYVLETVTEYLKHNTPSCSINNKTIKAMNLQMNSDLEIVKQQNVLFEQQQNIDIIPYVFLLSYDITTTTNIQMRFEYIKHELSNMNNKVFEEINEKIYVTLKEHFKRNTKIYNKDMPLDSLWLPDTKDKYTDLSESNQTFVHIYYMIIKILREAKTCDEPLNKKSKKLTILQYSKAVHAKKLSQYSIEHPLILKFWNLISYFDEFLTSLLKNQTLHLNNEDTIISILVLNWRIVLQDMGDVIVYDRSNKNINLNHILSQLFVRYKWFIKNTVKYFLKLNTNNEISTKLLNIIDVVNKSIVNNFSNFASISKQFIKQSFRPLPLINEEQINILTLLEELREKTSILITKNVDAPTKYNLMLNLREFNQKYIELRKEIRANTNVRIEKYTELVESYNNALLEKKTIKTDLQLLPIQDIVGVYIISDLVTRIFNGSSTNENCQILRKLTTIPVELNEILETYFDTRDKKLLPELTLLKTAYLTNAICLDPSYCLNASIEIENAKMLAMHLPVLSYSISNLCVALHGSKDLIKMVNFGTFKDKSYQLKFLNEFLWKSIPSFYCGDEYFINNDEKYIINSYNSFIQHLELSLTGQNSNQSISDVTEICINKINTIYSLNKESDEMLKNKDKIMSIFSELCVAIETLQKSSNSTEKLITIANVYCLLNYIKALFNSQLQVIDPLEKNVLKKKYSEEERIICANLRDAFVAQNEIYSGNTRTLHPFCAILSTKISGYLQKEIELDKLVAVRPQNISYQSVLQDVHHDLNTLLSDDFFLKMYNKLMKSLSTLQHGLTTKTLIHLEDCKDAYKQSLSWINSQNNSFVKLSKYRVGYPDVIESLLCNLTELSYGIKLLSSTLQKLIIKYEHLNEDLSLLVKNLIQFPVLNSSQKSVFELIELCTDHKNINAISNIINDEHIPNIAKQETLRLLKCSIQELYNVFVAQNPQYIESNDKILVYLGNLINLFVAAWYKQETEKQKKLEEEQSIYKTKSKCDDLTEEQQDLHNMKLLFPNYHELDFSDFQEKSLEDSNETMDDSNETEFVGIITIDDVKFVAEIHSEIMQQFTKSEWLNPKKKQLDFNFVTPLLERFKLCTLLQNQLIHGLDSDIETDLVASLNVLVAATRSYGEGENMFTAKSNSSPRKSKEKYYDFYKDSKVEEVKSCLATIEALKLRSDELLSEWPGHPTLQSICTIIERIYSFSITSPVSRFLTGFEILLSKCHEWEENAHSGVTLSEYLQSVTLQIISWRKLELAGWKDCLNNSAERMKNSVAKWWFHIYTTIQEFTNPDASTSTLELIKIFQEFIEKSPLGEFESRLELLYTFHCHVLHLPKTERTDIISSILWNLYNFYAQFLNNVELKIKNQRAPIEKKLKDFVKIARWNDINYWAVKATVEKTHKTLHKYIKDFEAILRQNVTECFVNSNSDTTMSCENVGIWDRPTRQNPSAYHYNLDVSNYMASVKFKKILNENQPINIVEHPESFYIQKIEKYFTKSRILCKDAIVASAYPNLIQTLDVFVADVIETSNHLRNLEVNTELEKPKQKSQAKSILLQKRKALADLFKTLAKCGLSYKTGLIEAKLRSDQYAEFLLKPIDLNASFGHLKTKGACDKQLLNVWDGCEVYFMRSIARLSALETALKQPAKDLGPQNIERCKGFSAHLMVLAQHQKEKLIESSRNLYYLRNYIHQMTEECGEQSEVIDTASMKSINDTLTNLVIVMEQYKIILCSCPEKPNFSTDVLDVPIVDAKTNHILIEYKNDANWSLAVAEIKNITAIAQKLKKSLDKLGNVFPASNIQNNELNEHVFIQDKSTIVEDLNNIAQKMHQLQEMIGNKSITNSLLWLLSEINTNLNNLQKNNYINNDQCVSIEKYTKDVEKLMEHILVIIQNVYKKYDDSLKKDETERTEQFDDDHLRILVIENLFTDLSTLEMRSIFKRVKKLIEKLHQMNSVDLKSCKLLLSNCVPLLEQITLMYQYFVTQQISAYRVTCKLTSVLLNIFVELAAKGFCVPEEFADELNKEGQSTQQSSGMGLGEGEGDKDVSDRIETEDQLDDAQPAGQEKQNEDKDCKEEDKGIEMSEDFEGKLQDVDKKPDDESQPDSSDSDAEKQMGDTEPEANKLDQQIWGSDEENEDDDDDDDDDANEEESGKQNKEEKGEGGEVEDQQMAAKEDGSKPHDDDDEEEEDKQEKRKEQQQKEINEIDEPEYDDEQTDPYHGNQPPLPEPEPMDLPDDLQLDDGEEKEEQGEENPFDIDSMKDQMPPEEEQPADGDEKKENDDNQTEEKADSSDEEEEEEGDTPPTQMDTEQSQQEEEKDEDANKDTSGIQEKLEEDEQQKIPEENEDASAPDNQQSKEDEIQPMDMENIETADNVQPQPNQSKAENPDQIAQEQECNEKEGVGQSQMEEAESGHRGELNAAKDALSAQREKEVPPKEKRQRPGEADSNRSLGETSEPIKKKLKTIAIEEANEEDDDDDDDDNEEMKDGPDQGKDAEMYQHIKEAKETDTQVMDAATQEQAETQRIQDLPEEEKTEDPITDATEMNTDPDVEPEPEPELKQKSEPITDSKTQKKKDGKQQQQQQQGDIIEEIKDVQVEGELVETMNVPRGTDSTYHTHYEFLNADLVDRLSTVQIQDLRSELESQLGTWKEPPPNQEAEQTWEKFSAITSSLARDLSEQLRLVLEPTQASSLRGDFRTGRRINMRKVIPYIASQFRKDKIWLRRTKPSKRDYQIVLAIDDSSSMDDNHSKELAFESVALISKALSLLESGQLAVVSFGETTEILHKLTDTFTEKSGVKLLQRFQFQQKKTCVANLVDFVTTMFGGTCTAAPNAKLLIVVSDGRGIFSEGETFVQQAIRRAKFANIFMVFVVIDNPENKNSILDIRMPMFKDGKLLGIKSYLDNFPFPFYIILRDINTLPAVLSDALRQWFELVTSVEK